MREKSSSQFRPSGWLVFNIGTTERRMIKGVEMERSLVLDVLNLKSLWNIEVKTIVSR
jgi:hypothetical protein